jgi:hypothetical protein
MPTVRTEEETYQKISRYSYTATIDVDQSGNRTVNNLDKIIEIGALLRLAESNEALVELTRDIRLGIRELNYKFKDLDKIGILENQVAKLSARLKKAGLDGNPDSDQRKRK